MFFETDLSQLFGELDLVAGSISIVFNTFLLYLIAYKSPKIFGAYKHLMFITSAFQILYSMVDMLLVTVHFVHESVIINLSRADNTLLGRPVLLALGALYWGCFGASLALFALLFVYRYVVISGHPLLSTFNSWKIALWLSIPSFFALSLVLTALIFSQPHPETTELIREKVLEMFGRSIDDFEYLGMHLYDTDQGRIVRYHWRSIFTLSVFFISTACSFCTIISFGIKCYNHLTSLLQISTSQHQKDIQSQLFWALVIQTLIPIFLMHIPVTTVLMAPLLRIDIGSYCLVLSATITLFPAIDPISNFFIIKPYRNAILNCLRCKKTSGTNGT